MENKEKKVFGSPQCMLYYILHDNDLYNTITGEYVFKYNEVGSIAVYHLSMEEAVELDKKASEGTEYWGAFLGPGGSIYDDPDYDGFDENLESNLDFCKNHFHKEGWVRCNP